ncbi:MAG: hypothetical protein AB7F21_09600 [Desulfuromonadales bacterium]|uniref:hypothetical protein n=1 Tax=Desulfuromonas sp. KJ2020 TaxID=2919173 RepID=UPI0020A6F8A6|nr:hypothetical protein [Desulfuromonas sp. KJ2020]MCP3175810.1 hypothetical protein [Desulfuromonas sp. KJ2020]
MWKIAGKKAKAHAAQTGSCPQCGCTLSDPGWRSCPRCQQEIHSCTGCGGCGGCGK